MLILPYGRKCPDHLYMVLELILPQCDWGGLAPLVGRIRIDTALLHGGVFASVHIPSPCEPLMDYYVLEMIITVKTHSQLWFVCYLAIQLQQHRLLDTTPWRFRSQHAAQHGPTCLAHKYIVSFRWTGVVSIGRLCLGVFWSTDSEKKTPIHVNRSCNGLTPHHAYFDVRHNMVDWMPIYLQM